MSETVRILSIDTAGVRGSIALTEGRAVVAELRLVSPQTHSVRLLKSIESLVSVSGWSLSDLGLIAVGIGPGSFTGIRIGVSSALGMAQSLSIPIAGISGLDALACEVGREGGRVGIALDAGRGQVYYAEYVFSRGRSRTTRRPGLWFPKDLDRELGRARLLLAGDGATRYARDLRAATGGARRLIVADLFLAAGIARVAMKRKRSWISAEHLSVEPLYIRPPDAMRSKPRRSA